MNRRSEAADRFAERRRQEDDAPRLAALVPDLVTCRVVLSEAREGVTSPDVTHTRHVVVATAPAHLFIPCSDGSCRDGGHDISRDLVHGLRERRADIHGEDTCFGRIGSADCRRVLRFHAQAQYAARVP